MDVLSDKILTALKHYRCDACDVFLDAGLSDDDLTPDELRVIQAARADRWQILPASQYRKVVSKDCGEFQTNRYRPDVLDICQRREFFDY
ncbi:MAG: hypothetical protein ACRD22_11335 [Terriglobia bacterium]